MTVDESKALKKDARVYWRGDAADSGIVTETSWDAATIGWNNGQVSPANSSPSGSEVALRPRKTKLEKNIAAFRENI